MREEMPPPIERNGVETTGTDRRQTNNQQKQLLGKQETTKSAPPPIAGLTTYQKRSELHGQRKDSYTAREHSEKSPYG